MDDVGFIFRRDRIIIMELKRNEIIEFKPGEWNYVTEKPETDIEIIKKIKDTVERL